RKLCSTSVQSLWCVTGCAFVSHTRKTHSTTLSPRGKTSALKIFKGTTENEPATFANNLSRSHVQNVTTLCPCSGTAFHRIAAASGDSPRFTAANPACGGLEKFSRKDRNNCRCSAISETSL